MIRPENFPPQEKKTMTIKARPGQARTNRSELEYIKLYMCDLNGKNEVRRQGIRDRAQVQLRELADNANQGISVENVGCAFVLHIHHQCIIIIACLVIYTYIGNSTAQLT